MAQDIDVLATSRNLGPVQLMEEATGQVVPKRVEFLKKQAPARARLPGSAYGRSTPDWLNHRRSPWIWD